MENETKTLGLRILKYLSKHQRSSHNTFSDLLRSIWFKTRIEFDAAISYLNEENFIETTTQIENNPSYNISSQGIEYIREFDDFELISVFNGFLDYAILKFLFKMKGQIYSDAFPESILSHVPPIGMGMDTDFNLRSYIEFDSSLKKYVVINNNDGSISLNYLGEKYYEHLEETNKKNTEIRNKPLVHFEYTDNSVKAARDINAPVVTEGIKDSFKVNEESVGSKDLAKQSLLWTKRNVLIAIIAIAVTIAIYLLSR